MSATVDVAMLAGYFGSTLRTPVAHVAVDGRSYPVETRHWSHNPYPDPNPNPNPTPTQPQPNPNPTPTQP